MEDTRYRRSVPQVALGQRKDIKIFGTAVARQVTGDSIPAIESERREGDPPELYADPSKAMNELAVSYAYRYQECGVVGLEMARVSPEWVSIVRGNERGAEPLVQESLCKFLNSV